MLSRDDVRGVYALPPTPCKEGAGGWDVADSVDLDEAARLVENLIAAGVGGIGLCGTTGECAALLWDEKREYVDTVVQVARKRVPIIAGATALGTKEVVRQMRGLKDVGADGVLVGLPLWQTPTPESSVRFYADLAEALPDLPVMVYANSMFFKSVFPVEFWEAVAKRAPTTIMCKVSYGIGHIEDDLRVAGDKINFVVGHANLHAAYEKVGTKITACWATAAGMGPEPIIALMDAILRDDRARAKAIQADLDALPSMLPPGVEFYKEFPKYNAQVVKVRSNAAGYAKYGPFRAPYTDIPEEWVPHMETEARAWAALCKKYASVPAS
ncbi:MAG TPA: dihydrodipicolinate synthase family protein [Chloroflexota bacterium]|jgi:trans-o-hydroxybenzylidenepyruvate hydratase-aldolase